MYFYETEDLEKDYPWIRRRLAVCKIDAETGEVALLLDYPVRNLVYSGGYVYFCDPSDQNK